MELMHVANATISGCFIEHGGQLRRGRLAASWRSSRARRTAGGSEMPGGMTSIACPNSFSMTWYSSVPASAFSTSALARPSISTPWDLIHLPSICTSLQEPTTPPVTWSISPFSRFCSASTIAIAFSIDGRSHSTPGCYLVVQFPQGAFGRADSIRRRAR